MRLQRTWKKITAAGLALVLAALCVGCKQEATVTEEPKQLTAAEAQIGDVVYGFALTETEELPVLNATMTVWHHEKTGAEAYFVKNSDPELGFTMCLRTEAPDESALPQVLSEMIVDSTKDYPGTNVMEAAKDSAYLTDLGTVVTPASTGYYVTSLSEDQLEKMTDYYLDCAFYSDFAEHENFFNYNVWRRHMTSYGAPIELTGTVYESRKSYHSNIRTAHLAHVCQTLFPDTYQQYTGTPDAVLALSLDDVVQYYEQTYHPSNMTCLFYGDLEADRFLKRMDKEFSKFEAKEYTPAQGQTTFAEPARAEYPFAVTKGNNLGAVLSYSVVLPQSLEFAQITALQTGASVLNDANSDLMQQLKASQIAGAYSVSFQRIGGQAILHFRAQEADTARAEEFKQIVLSAVQTQDEALVKSYHDAQKLQQTLVFNNAGLGKTMGQKLIAMVDTGEPEQLRHWSWSEKAYELSKDGGLAALLTQAVTENPHGALVITMPQKGMAEEARTQLRLRLEEEKAAMTEEEIRKLERASIDVLQWASRLTPSNTLDYLCVDLDEIAQPSMPVYETVKTEENGVTFCTAQVDGDALACKVQYDLSHLTVEQVRLMRIYVDLLGISTANRESKQVQMEKRALLQDFDVQVTASLRADQTAYPVLNVSFTTAAATAQQAVELVKDMLCSTKPELHYPELMGVINAQMHSYRNPAQAVTILGIYGGLAGSSDASALEYSVFDLNCYNNLLTLRYTDPYVVCEQIKQARDAALVRRGTIICAAADDDVDIGSVLSPLIGQDAAVTPDPHWSTVTRSEATAMGIKASDEDCYAMSLLQIDAIGVPVSAELILCAEVLEDRYIAPRFESKKDGAVASASLRENGIFLTQLYRVEEFEDACKELSGLPEELRLELDTLTDVELASYQRTKLSELSRSAGKWKEAMEQLHYEQIGLSAEQRRSMLEDVLAASPTSVADAAAQMEEIMDAAVWVVIAPGEAIDNGAYLFDRMELLP